jgi:hypothetical protein
MRDLYNLFIFWALQIHSRPRRTRPQHHFKSDAILAILALYSASCLMKSGKRARCHGQRGQSWRWAQMSRSASTTQTVVVKNEFPPEIVHIPQML